MTKERHTGAFVCRKCRKRIDEPGQQYEARLDYRRADGKKRPHSRKLYDICRACMDAEVAEREGMTGEQVALDLGL